MTLIRWQPAREIESLQRLFGSVFHTPTPSPSRTGAVARRWIPAMDLVEGESDYVLRADLPGLSSENVSIEVQDNVLTVAGERKSEHETSDRGYYRLERASGSFSRSLTLPEGVDAATITADFDNGVLSVSIPKPQHVQPQRISIGIGGAEPQVEGPASEQTEPQAA